MMCRPFLRLSVGLLTALAFAGIHAEDQRISLPRDWEVTAEGLAVGPDRIAYSGIQLTAGEGGERTARGRIFQQIGDELVTTDCESKCTAVRYSPDGKTLLALQFDPDAGSCCDCPVRPLLIDADGKIVAQLEYGHRTFDFSTTGELIYQAGWCETCDGERVDLYDLTGRLLRTLNPGSFWKAIVIGNGSDLILQDQHALWRVGEAGGAAWARNIGAEHPYDRKIFLPPDKLLVTSMSGRIGTEVDRRLEVIDFGGAVVYRYDSAQLAAGRPASEAAQLRIFDVHAGPPNTVWLTRPDGDYLVKLADGSMSPIKVDRTPPPDFENRYPGEPPIEQSGKMVFVGKKEIVIRAVDFGGTTGK